MAIKKQIEIDVNTKSLGQLENMLSNVNEELKNVDRNSDTFKELAAKSQILNKEIEKINNQIEGIGLDDKLMAADGAAKIFGGSLSAVVGTLGTLGIESEAFGAFEEKAASAIAVGLGIKDVSEGFGQFTQVMKKSGIAAKLFGSTTSRALIATGVGAFVVLLGTVIAYWDDITKSVKRFANNVPFVGDAINFVKDTFNSLFDAARPVLEFLGILPDAAEVAAQKTKEVTSGVIKELERELALAQARGDSEKQLFKLREQLLQQELSMLQQGNADKDEIYKKETELLALQIAEQKRLREEAENNVVRKKVETVNQIQAVGKKEVENNAKITGELLTNRNQLAKEDVIIEKLSTEQKMQLASNALGDLSTILGKESEAGKAAAIAQTTIDTYQAAQASFKSLAGIPIVGPALGAVAAGAAVAAGIANVKAINSVGPSISTPNIGNQVRGTQPPAFNIVGAAPENQLAQAIGEQDKKPVKAFVVSSEVSNQQALDRKIQSGASLG